MAYNNKQREDAFQAWYRSGAGALLPFVNSYLDSKTNRKIALQTIQRWHSEYEWKYKARKLDMEAAKDAEKKLKEERVKMRERQAQIGKLLQSKALVTVSKSDFAFQTEYGVLSALRQGSELERQALGAEEEFYRSVKDMSDEDLETLIADQRAALESDSEGGFESGVVPKLKAPVKAIEAPKPASQEIIDQKPSNGHI